MLVPHLEPSSKFEVLKEAIETVSEISDSSSQARMLSNLAPNLTEELLEEAFKTAFLIEPSHWRDDAVAKLVLRLARLHRFEDALAKALAIQSEYTLSKVISQLVPLLANSLLEETLAIARSIERYDAKVTALSSIIPRLSGSLKEDVSREAFDIAKEIELEEARGSILIELVPILPDNLLNETLMVIRKIENDDIKGPLLAKLILFLPEPLKENVLRETLASISKIQYGSKDFDYRPMALGKLAPYMAELSHIKLYPLWCETLHLLAYHTREDLLVDLQALIPAIVALGGPDALEETAQAIEDVGSWWP